MCALWLWVFHQMAGGGACLLGSSHFRAFVTALTRNFVGEIWVFKGSVLLISLLGSSGGWREPVPWAVAILRFFVSGLWVMFSFFV